MNRDMPHDLEIEKSVLGSLLLDKKLNDIVLKLHKDNFYDKRCKLVLESFQNLVLAKKTVDIITLSNDLRGKAIGDAFDYIVDLTQHCIPASYKSYLEKLIELSDRRFYITKSIETMEAAYTQTFENRVDMKNELLAKFDNNVDDDSKKDFRIGHIMAQTLINIEERYNNKNDEKLCTGFSDLDRVTAGFHDEELTIIAARPGIGKTTFLLQILLNLCQKGNSCVMFSGEMSSGQLGERLLSNLTRINGQKIRFAKGLTTEEFKKLGDVTCAISSMPLIINDEIMNVESIRSYCRELKNNGKLDLIAVDYLQLFKTLKKTQNRENEVATISREFKLMSKEFKVPVIVLSQFSRSPAKESREPILTDLRESGAIEQDADNVIFLHVPEDTDEAAEMLDIKVIIAKQRNGPTGHIWLKYGRKVFKFWGCEYAKRC